VASLGPEDAADWRLIDDQIGQQLLELDRIQNYKHNPTVYVETLGSAIFQPFTDDYAAENVRLGDILSRIARGAGTPFRARGGVQWYGLLRLQRTIRLREIVLLRSG
jgi:hypothetical protein